MEIEVCFIDRRNSIPRFDQNVKAQTHQVVHFYESFYIKRRALYFILNTIQIFWEEHNIYNNYLQ